MLCKKHSMISICMMRVLFCVLLSLGLARAVQHVHGCTDKVAVAELVGVGTTLPQKLYQDALWLYYHTTQQLSACYYSQGSWSGVCRMKGWLPANCTLDCVEATGCMPCHSDCPEWEHTGHLSPPDEADFGATDMRLIDEDYEKAPGLQLLPTMAAAMVPIYNLGGLLNEALVLDRHVLPLIFSGNLTRWNDARLKALQASHVADMLPDEPIEVVVRGDTSGSTHIWKNALIAFSDAFRLDQEATGSTRLGEPTWGNAAHFQPTRQVGTRGVAGHVLNQQYTLGYVVLSAAKDFGLEIASFFRNESGTTVQASGRSVEVAVVETSFQWTSLVDVSRAHGSPTEKHVDAGLSRESMQKDIVDTKHPGSWPISGYTYIIVNKDARSSRMRRRTCKSHQNMVEFWRWFLAEPSVEELMVKQDFVPLPKTVVFTLRSWLMMEVRCDGQLSAIQEHPLVIVSGSVPPELSYEFDVIGPSYEQVAQVSLEMATHTEQEAQDAWSSDSLAFLVSINEVDALEETEKAVSFMWTTLAFVVLVNLDGISAQSTLRITTETLASILSGQISRWDDPALVADNLELVGINRDIVVFSKSVPGVRCEPLLENALHHALQRNTTCLSPEVHSANYVQVLERMSATPYSIALLPMLGSLGNSVREGYLQGDFGIATLKDDVHTMEYVPPTQEALAKCVPVPGEALRTPRNCYPFHLHVFVTFKRDYGPNCVESADASSTLFREQGEEAVRFWLWELAAFKKNNVISDSLATEPLHMYNIGPEWRDHQQHMLEKVGCGGVSFLKPGDKGNRNEVYLMLLLSSGGVLVIILAATAIILRKNRLLQNKVLMLEKNMSMGVTKKALDLESPILKVIRYLTRLSDGAPVEKDVAQRLAEMLQRTDSFDRPDLRQQLASDSYDSQIVDFIMSNTRRASAADALNHCVNHHTERCKYGFESLEDVEDNMCKTLFPGSVANLVPEKINKYIKVDTPAPGPNDSANESMVSTRTVGSSTGRELKRGPSMIKVGKAISIKTLGSPTVPGNSETRSMDQQLMGNPRLSQALKTIGVDYFYDILELHDASDGCPLTCATVFLFQRTGLIKEFSIDMTKLERYMSEIERGYLAENSYHNAIHAADVVQRTCTILTHCCSRFLSKLQLLSALLAAAIHDLRHPGTTNAYHVAQCNELAMRFNDQHVLENHSLVLALGLLRRPGFDFLENISEFQQRKVRSAVIDMVLATDMSLHFEMLSKFQYLNIGSKPADGELDDKTITQVMRLAIKCADVGHCTLPYRQHLYWVTCLQEEFFQQGDAEAEMNMTISPLMDRNRPGPLNSKNQIGFLDVIVMPLFKAFGDALDGMQPMRDQLNTIMMFWKNLQDHGHVLQKSLPTLREEISGHRERLRAQGILVINQAETMDNIQYDNVASNFVVVDTEDTS